MLVRREGRDVHVVGSRILDDRGRVDIHVRWVQIIQREHCRKFAGESRAAQLNRRIGQLPAVARCQVIGFPPRDRAPPRPNGAQPLLVIAGRDPVAEICHVTSDPLIPKGLVLRITMQLDAVSTFPREPKAVGRREIAESEWTEVWVLVQPIPFVTLLGGCRGVFENAPRRPRQEVVRADMVELDEAKIRFVPVDPIERLGIPPAERCSRLPAPMWLDAYHIRARPSSSITVFGKWRWCSQARSR